MNELERPGLIEARRGAIQSKKGSALEEAANGSYGAAESDYRRLFGNAA